MHKLLTVTALALAADVALAAPRRAADFDLLEAESLCMQHQILGAKDWRDGWASHAAACAAIDAEIAARAQAQGGEEGFVEGVAKGLRTAH